MDVRAPYDGALLGTIEPADEAGVDAALGTAAALFGDRDAWLPAGLRVEVLRRAADLLEQEREPLALAASREGGKPLVDSRIESDRAVDSLRCCAETLRTRGGREIPMDLNAASAHRLAFTRHEPLGVVVAFSAFNHPINLVAHQAGPAIAAGCPIIVKPAEATPLSGLRVVEILREAGLPEGWCQGLVTADHDLSAHLACDERVGFFSFIGSAGVGWMLRSRLAPGTRCALEHGGAAPVIVAADADLEDALPLLLRGGFYHAGQVCVSVQRVFAQRAIAGELASALAARAGRLRVGDPADPATEVGPLIRPAEVQRVHEWVEEAVEGGGELLCGGEPIGPSCYSPTVLLDPAPHARVSREEVFGPVVCVYGYDDEDAAIAAANGMHYAFQAAVFTRDLDRALRLSRRLDASAVMVNDHTAFRVDWMPFAGLRRSGLGVGGIPATISDMQVEKMYVVRSREL